MAQPHFMGAPEGTRAHPTARRPLVRRPEQGGAFAAIVLLSTLLAIAIGDETASLTVTNRTQREIDVVVAEQAFPHVAPGAHVTYRTAGSATVKVTAAYAAGQGIVGSAQRSFVLASAGSGGATVYWGCFTGGSIVSPSAAGPMEWNVTADTLAVR